MKQKATSLLVIFLLIIITFLLMLYSSSVMDTVSFSISIWKDNLLPSLFPFFVISELLINYGFVDLLGEALKGLMNKVFGLPGDASFVIIGSLISGFPSSSKYINELLIKEKISLKDAEYLLKFNHFSNPLFVIGTIGTLFLNNKQIGIIILITHIISNFLVAIIFRPKKTITKDQKSSISKGINAMHKKRISNNSSFSLILSNSIFKSFKTLLLLLGIITCFLIITTFIKKIFSINDLSYSVISGLLEMTGGIRNISSLSLPINIKASIITFLISFGGFSIHLQVMSILSNQNIRYFPYFISRILHAIISSSLVFFILSFTQFQ